MSRRSDFCVGFQIFGEFVNPWFKPELRTNSQSKPVRHRSRSRSGTGIRSQTDVITQTGGPRVRDAWSKSSSTFCITIHVYSLAVQHSVLLHTATPRQKPPQRTGNMNECDCTSYSTWHGVFRPYTGWFWKRGQCSGTWQYRSLTQTVHINKCLIMNGYRHTAVRICTHKSFKIKTILQQTFTGCS